jgi:phage antirepressor YoqD-like protein
MKTLPITTSEDGVDTVSGYHLYSVMKAKGSYAEWTEENIASTSLELDKDYLFLNQVFGKYVFTVPAALKVAEFRNHQEIIAYLSPLLPKEESPVSNALMNITSTDTLTMSSREIAELVETRHPDVCLSIERLMKSGAIGGYTALPYTHPQNKQEYKHYQINKRDSYVIVAQLSPLFTARLVDRWQELEAQVAKPTFEIPTTLSGALLMAAKQAEQIEQQQLLLSQQAPAVEFVDKYVVADGLYNLRDAAKVLGVKSHKFNAYLVTTDILFYSSRKLVPYARIIDSGYMVMKATNKANGNATTQTMITPKGMTWLAKLAKAFV